MYKILQNEGVKNNKFFLKLYDDGLVGIDPYDENLTPEYQARILAEIIRNPWYFLREVVMITVPGGSKHYELHKGNLAITYCMLNNLNVIEMLPRQHGKTISTVCLYIWFYKFACTNSNILFLNKEFNDSKLNLKRFKDIYDLLPEYLKFSQSKSDTDNIEYIASKTTGNTIRALATAHSEDDADKKGRGNTAPMMWFDEFAFLKYNQTIYTAGAPAVSQAMIEAKNNGKYYGKVITTTPNNVDKREGSYCKSMIDNACPFSFSFYDKDPNSLFDYIDKNSNNNFVYVEYSYKELGKDDEWFRLQCKELNNDLLKIKRELLLEWTRSSETSVFSEEQLDKIFINIKKPIGSLTCLGYYEVMFYQNIDFTKTWIIGVDPSNALEKDATAITIFDPFSFEVVGEFRNNRIDTDEIKKLIYELVSKYLPNSIVAIENNIGKHILDALMKTSIEKNLYYEYKETLAQKIEESMTEITYAKNKKRVKIYGINTNTYSRAKMMEIMMDVVNNEPEKIATKYLYSDCKDMERDKNGKIQHREEGHDDSMFSYLVGRYMLSDGTNLKKFKISTGDKNYTKEESRQSIIRVNNLISTANQDKMQIFEMEKAFMNDDKEYHVKTTSRKVDFFNSLLGDIESEEDKNNFRDIPL
jgi:hypothetical protein